MFKSKDEKKLEQEQQLAKEALPGFRKEYSELVEKYGFIHGIRWTMPTALEPSQPFITEVFIKKQLDQAKQAKVAKASVVVKS